MRSAFIDSEKIQAPGLDHAEYELVRISPEHYSDFRELAERSFGVKPNPDEVARLFDTAAFGAEHIGYVAYHRESREPAAFYGIFPCFVEIDGKRILAAQSGSTMTHPNHRRKNLFYLTGRKTYELAKQEGIAFVLGFPNQFSYRGLMKLGWTHAGDLARFRMIIATFPLGYFGTFLTRLRAVHRWLFRRVVKRWKIPAYPFPSSAIEPGTGGMHRSELSFAYKPEDDDHVMLRFGNSVAWINQVDGQIGIGDLQLANREGEFAKVLRAIKWVAFLSGCSVVRTYVSDGSRLGRLFEEHGYSDSTALPNCYLELTGETDPSRFKWVYGDFDTF